MTAPALDIVDITAGYETTTVLRGVNVAVQSGSVVALLGPNGAGKSTLLKTVSGLLQQTKGTISFNGTNVDRLRPSERTALGLCYTAEGRAVYRSLTVRENLMMQSRRGGEKEAIERAVTAFPPLGSRLNQVAGRLSGGEQQMLALVRSYIRDPTLVLVDEASLGLAPLVVDAIFEFLVDLSRAGASLLIVDQFVSRALEIADHAYVLTRGTVTYSGDPAVLRERGVFEHYLGRELPIV